MTDNQAKEFALNSTTTRVQLLGGRKVIGAPKWLRDRIAKLKELPPPTLEEVRTAWRHRK